MILAKIVTFAAAHRLLNYEGKCSNLHGHDWKAIFKFKVDKDNLDKSGISVDFGKLKPLLEEVVPDHDDVNRWLYIVKMGGDQGYETIPVPIQFSTNMSPSAENIALALARKAIDIASTLQIEFYSLTLYESDTSFVEVNGNDIEPGGSGQSID